MVYDKLAEWAARLTTSNIAHVIFLTTDVSFSKSLAKALPDRVFRQVTLGDCTPEVAKKMVVRYLDADADADADVDSEESAPGEKKLAASQTRSDLDELDSVIQVLGGRLTDLEFLARRIKAGESPSSAVRQITEQSASEILKMYLLDADHHWSPQQAWILIRELAANEKLRYNELLLDAAFSTDGEAVLQSLEQAELISIASHNGRPTSIKPGKPIYQAAFESLTEDAVLRAHFEMAVLTDLVGKENKTIDKAEAELKVLSELGSAGDLRPRVRYLLAKVLASQQEIEKMEARQAGLKKVLKEQF